MSFSVVSAQPTAPQSSVFGFNYTPQFPVNGKCFFDREWREERRTIAERDLDQLSAMGCGVIRVMLCPFWTGFDIMDSTQKLHSELKEGIIGEHFAEFLRMAIRRNMKVIIAFNNLHVYAEPSYASNPALHRNFWYAGYGNGRAAFLQFVADSKAWMRFILKPVLRDAEILSSLIMIDVQNESYDYFNANQTYSITPKDTVTMLGCYLTTMLDEEIIPKSKQGISFIEGDDYHVAYVIAQLQKGKRRDLPFIDYHVYSATPKRSIEKGYANLKRYFPKSTILLGETGIKAGEVRNGLWQWDEARQIELWKETFETVKRLKIPYVLNWEDGFMGYGMASYLYPYNYFLKPVQFVQAKDIVGQWNELISGFYEGDAQSRIQNSDMEEGESAPDGWSAAGVYSRDQRPLPLNILRVEKENLHPNDALEKPGFAATGKAFLRVTTAQADAEPPLQLWISSSMTPLIPSPKKKLYLNAFLRTSMASFMGVALYDSNGVRLPWKPRHHGPLMPKRSESQMYWKSYLHEAGAFAIEVEPEARYFRVIVGGISDVAMPSGVIEVDAVTHCYR